jgi:hypothetical protein
MHRGQRIPFSHRLNTAVSAIISVAFDNDASHEGLLSFTMPAFALP